MVHGTITVDGVSFPLTLLEIANAIATRCGYNLDVKPQVEGYRVTAWVNNSTESLTKAGATLDEACQKVIGELWNGWVKQMESKSTAVGKAGN